MSDLREPRCDDRPQPRSRRPGRRLTHRLAHRLPRRLTRRLTRRRVAVVGRGLYGAGSTAVLLASGLTWAAYHDLTGGMSKSEAIHVVKPGERGYVAPRLDGSVNLLLIGLDSRRDMEGNDLPTAFVQSQLHAGSSDIGGYNTNVLILLHIPADSGQVTAFSIARDDYVELPGGDSGVGPVPNLGRHKIKEAYGRAKSIAADRLKAGGETDQARIEAVSREVGRESTIRAVQLLTGEHIDHLAEINLLGFYDIAEAVGPIQVCLNHPVDDPIEDGAGTGLKLPAGYSTLDAPAALQFVRQRFHLLRGDFDRNRRQQAFLAAVLRKLRDDGVLGDLGRMRSLFDVVKKDLVIDDDWDVLDFAGRAQNLTGGNAVFRELPITGQPTLPDDGSVNTVDPAQIRKMVMTAFGDGDLYVPDDPSPVATATATASGSGSGSGSGPTSASASASATAASSPSPSPSASPSADTSSSADDAAVTSGYAGPAAPTGPAGPRFGPTTRPAPAPDADTVPEGRAVVDLFNAGTRHGAVGAAAAGLNAAGWPVDHMANAAAQPRSTVFYGPGAAADAARLAARLGLTAVPEARTRTAAHHVQIYLGSDYTPSGGPGPDSTPGPAGGASASQDPVNSSAAAVEPPPAIAAHGITCVN